MKGSSLHYFTCREERSAELIVVEGKHAANAVNRIRNKGSQAVLAMQGMVPNAVKINQRSQLSKINKNVHVKQLTTILNSWAQPTSLSVHRYSQVLVLSDPDADGVYAAMLLICLLSEVFPELVREKGVHLCRCPLYMIGSENEKFRFAFSEAEMQRLRNHEECRSGQIQRFKGVAGIPSHLLHRACIDPLSRTASLLSEADCDSVKCQLL